VYRDEHGCRWRAGRALCHFEDLGEDSMSNRFEVVIDDGLLKTTCNVATKKQALHLLSKFPFKRASIQEVSWLISGKNQESSVSP